MSQIFRSQGGGENFLTRPIGGPGGIDMYEIFCANKVIRESYKDFWQMSPRPTSKE